MHNFVVEKTVDYLYVIKNVNRLKNPTIFWGDNTFLSPSVLLKED
jgi:hypothetical protein